MSLNRVLISSHQDPVLSRWEGGFDRTWLIRAAKNKGELLAAMKAHCPDVILLHLRLPGLQNGQSIQLLRTLCMASKVIVFSDQPDETEERTLLRSGIHGYLNTYALPQRVQKAVTAVLAGEMWVTPRVLAGLYEEARLRQSQEVAQGTHPELASLTPREREIALLVGEGLGNRAIADRLNICERTVKTHLTYIFEKTGSKDRVHLALLVSGAHEGRAVQEPEAEAEE